MSAGQHWSRYAANGRRLAWLVSEKGLFLVSTFFVGAWVVRTLGPHAFGKFSIALSITAVLASVATVGLDAVLLRRFTAGVANARETLLAAMGLRLAGSVAHLLLSFLAALLLFPDDLEVTLVTLIVASAALFRVLEVVGLRLQTADHYPLSSAIRLLARMCGDAMRIGLIATDASIVGFALAILAEAAIGALLFLYVERSTMRGTLNVNQDIAHDMFRQGWPLAISGLIAGLYARVDQAVVYSVLGSDANGQYAAAARISELFNLLIISIAAVATPHFAQFHGADDSEFDLRLRRYFRSMLVAGIFTAVVVALSADLIIGVLYGASFAPATQVLRIHAWTIPLVFVSAAMEPWFHHYGKLDLYLQKTILSLVLSIPLVLVGAVWLGSMGVAFGVVATYSISVFGSNAILPGARKAFRFQTWAMFGIANGGEK